MADEQTFTHLTEVLKNGGIAVVRTDTIYGIIALASDEAAVEKVYAAKHRNPLKQCIVLIPNAESVPAHASHIARYGGLDQPPTSVIVPKSDEPEWLLRGGDTIAYRVVRDAFLKRVVEAVGPVIAPSANPEGLPPARTINEAGIYLGDSVDVYVDGGIVPDDVQASRIIKVSTDGSVTTVRA
jgi:L-threonylcarbamoyladenylate synthase